MSPTPSDTTVEVRRTTAGDARYAEIAAGLIADASVEHDIAQRDPEFLRKKIESGRAALALSGERLIGFGYYSEWQGGKFVSHSGLVVVPEARGQKLGLRLKMCLFEASRERFPDAVLMSLTTSPAVKAMNLALGFRVVPIEELTEDPAFWEGCKSCRNYEEVQARGQKCCCEAMILDPKSDFQSPNLQSPNSQSPDSQSPDSQSPDSQSPDSQSPDFQSPDFQSPEENE